MNKHRITWLVGMLGIAVCVPFLLVSILTTCRSLLGEEPQLGVVFFMLPTLVPVLFTLYNSYHLTRKSSKNNIERTIGCLCLLLVLFGTSSLLTLVPEEYLQLLLPWGYLIATVLGILLYAIACKKLLHLEGFDTHVCELFGGGQLAALAFLIWLSLSSLNEDPTDDSGLMLTLTTLGPIVASVAFFRIGRRVLVSAQRNCRVQAN